MAVSVAHSLTADESLVLNDGQCELVNQTQFFRLEFEFGSCGTIQQIKSGKEVVYRQVINKKSEVGTTNIISREGELAITRDSRFQITLFCSFDAKGVATAFFRSLQEVPLNATDFNTFQYSLRLYQSARYKDFFNQTDYPVVVTIGEEIHFGAVLITKQPGLKVYARTCWASQTNSPVDPARYYLQRDGCPTDPTFRRIFSDDPYMDKFSFEAFQLVVDQTAVIYVHCELYSCDATDTKTSLCRVPDDCNEGFFRRQRRQIREQFNEGGNYERVIVSQGGALVFMKPDDISDPNDHLGGQEQLFGMVPSSVSGDAVSMVEMTTFVLLICLLTMMTCGLCFCCFVLCIFKLKSFLSSLFDMDTPENSTCEISE